MNSSDAVQLQLVPSLDDTFGALLIGTCLAAMLYGLTTHQCYRYLRLYPADGWGLKSMVACLWLLDTFHTTLSVHTCYFYLVTSYSDPESLPNGVWSARLLVSITSIVTAISHLRFLSRRLYLLGNRSATLVIAFVLQTLVRLGFGLALSIEAFVQPTFRDFERFTWLICSSLGSAVLCDASITIALCVVLRRSRTGYKRTDCLIDVMIVYTINTGLLTGMFTLAALICAAAMPRNFIYLALYIIVSKMYTNSLLAILNSRRSIVDRGAEGMETGSFGLANPAEMRTSRRWDAASPSVRPSAAKKSAVIDVKVTTETVQQIDTEEEQFHENRLSSLKEAFAI